MSQRPNSTSAPTTDALRQQMERSIDELADLARGDVEPGQFFGDILRRALQPGGAVRGILWRRTLSGTWELGGELPIQGSSGHLQPQLHDLLVEVAESAQPQVIRREVETGTQTQIFSPLRHAGQTIGILETHYAVDANISITPETYQFLAAMSEIAADYLSQQELQQLRLARQLWQQADQYLIQLGRSFELDDVAAVIANDGRQLIACDRISVLVRRRNGYRLLSASGVERIDPRAGTVRSLESLAIEVATHQEPIFQQVSELAETDPTGQDTTTERLNQSLKRHAQASGALYFAAFPARGESAEAPPVAVIAFEHFHPHPTWLDQKPRAALLIQRSAPFLRAAIERAEIPWMGVWQAIQKGPRLLRRPAVGIGALLAVVIIALLAIVPAEFTISGYAELWPERRRDVFASTMGVVDQILVKHGDDVQQDQPLITLRDPELDQDASKITGEIATTTERLRGVQIARLTGTASPEPSSRPRQLAADEEELKERLKTLERQRVLVEERQQRLNLKSPLAGRVLTWDVAQHLSARPVERGQSLLTIGDTNGPWIVEVRVADKDIGPLLRAQSKSGPSLDVDFQLPSEPGRTYHGTVRDISLASESDDRSSGHVRVIVQFDSTQVEQLRPGATAIPRIRCGKQPVGYVWLHDLIDAVQTRLLF